MNEDNKQNEELNEDIVEAYGIEQQAEIVRHAFLLKRGAPVKGAPDRGVYEALLPFRSPDQVRDDERIMASRP